MGTSLERGRDIQPRPTVTTGHVVPSVRMPPRPEGQAANKAPLGLGSSLQKEDRACRRLSFPTKVAAGGDPSGACLSGGGSRSSEKEGADVLLGKVSAIPFPSVRGQGLNFL